jgi:hypothetical protein
MDDHHQRERGAEGRKWDDAVGRRVIKIPSGPSLDLWEVDPDLEDKILQNEAEGVLASLVAGCARWHQLRSVNGTGLEHAAGRC